MRAWLLGLTTVATGNVHAHARTRAPLQDAFVAIAHHTTLDASEPVRRGNFSHVLASPQAMAARFPEHPAAVAETVVLADRLRFDLHADLGYRYPGAEDGQALRRLAELCGERLQSRYGPGRPGAGEARSRLEAELQIIDRLGLAGFFLLHHDMLELAREVAVEVRGPQTARSLLPPGRGRGSSVSSIVCYLTGLSHVDPIANDLLIGRFLNEELTSLPDIDLDFPRDIRAALLPRIHERYGREHSALVAAFPTYRARGAIRDLGRALGLPPGEIERVARGSEGWDARQVGRDIDSALEPGAAAGLARAVGPDTGLAGVVGPGASEAGGMGPGSAGRGGRRSTQGRWRWLAVLAAEAHGLPRHLSQHSGGMIVSTRPLIDCCPVVPAAMEGRQIAQWDKDSCADAGFLKIDLLGLGMLSAVERCVELIARNRNERIDLSTIPYDDPATYECIQQADTTGVFQIESRAQMQSLRRTRPRTLQDLTIQVAIVRPGPIQGGAVNPYIERRQALNENPDYVVPYAHPSLEEPLRETLGTIIFQDQVLGVAQAFAGFSVGEAEGLRRAMSRKRSEAAIEAYHRRFIDGARAKHGVTAELAERVFGMVKGFSGFGFPKAHGAAFGLLAYQSTWLRVHHGPEFLCSLLNEQPMGFYPPDALIHEAQRRGIELHPPDVNRSEVECDVGSDGVVRVGLGYIRGARREELEALVDARRREGPFRSLSDLASRAGAGRAALELLAWSGACDSLVLGEPPATAGATPPGAAAHAAGAGASAPPAAAPAAGAGAPARSSGALGGISARRQVLWQLGVAAPGRSVPGGVQLALPLDLPAPPRLMVADYETAGMTTRTHPLALLRGRLPAGAVSSEGLRSLPHASRVQTAGLVVARQRPGTAAGVVFVLLEDEFGTINLVVPPKVYEQHRLTVRTEPLLVVAGKLEAYARAGGAINILVDRITQLNAPDQLIAQVKDFSLLDEQVRLGQDEQAGREGQAGAEGQTGRNEPVTHGQEVSDRCETDDFRAVAPAVMSFGAGRRR